MEKFEVDFCKNYFRNYDFPNGVSCGCIKTPIGYCVHFSDTNTVAKIKDPCADTCKNDRKLSYEA